MSHLSMTELLALREPGLEPGVQGWRDHVEQCDLCRAELDRLEQRVARIRALPTLRPGRDLFHAVRAADRARRRRRRWQVGALSGLALAASVMLAVVTFDRSDRELVAVSSELEAVMERSRALERALAGLNQDRGVVDGRAVSITTSLEDRVARIDRQLEVVDLLENPVRETQALRLWRERVGLLDALVDVRVTGARYVGF